MGRIMSVKEYRELRWKVVNAADRVALNKRRRLYYEREDKYNREERMVRERRVYRKNKNRISKKSRVINRKVLSR